MRLDVTLEILAELGDWEASWYLAEIADLGGEVWWYGSRMYLYERSLECA